MTNQADIHTCLEGENITIVAAGELDLTNADSLCRALDQATARDRAVAVDLQRAEFIDTAILSCLARYGKRLMDTPNRLRVIVSLGSHPDYVLKTVGFSGLMDIEVVSPKAKSVPS